MRILIAEDEISVRNALFHALKDSHDVLTAENGEDALKILEKTSVDLVLSDHQMPKMTGLELLKRGREASPSTAFIMMTAFGTVEQAVEAIRLGAEDYFMKPFDISELEHRIKRIEDLRAYKIETALKNETGRGVRRLIGSSSAIAEAKAFVEKVAAVQSPVMLLGPSGSGKEVLAKAIHESGPRPARPFIAINCASLSEQLLESELFGHEKGAFTGAVAAKPGKFELAQGGTLFLDEVAELSPGIQAKLLRVLQEREFYRVGGVRQIKTDARVIAATHRPLKEMVKVGQFREDLFFRLNVLSYELKSLSQRRDDIPVLVDFFWNKLSKDLGRKTQLAPEAVEALSRYAFPGNIRELQNLLERLMVLAPEGGTVQPSSLPQEVLAGTAPLRAVGSTLSVPAAGLDEVALGALSGGLPGLIDEIEAKLIQRAMNESGGNQVKAAELLKIGRGTLQYKLKKIAGSGAKDEADNVAPIKKAA